ncbi:MAG: hypothetical protein CVV27_16630 [Candidatus Melainabacteria bacterium HGW-Melainabacteria-1]|nr:MAG: hypothetical protein CVV27_16630 [Candidatus Melainabacteria bacterium HGW-Melainabacteria-1]
MKNAYLWLLRPGSLLSLSLLLGCSLGTLQQVGQFNSQRRPPGISELKAPRSVHQKHPATGHSLKQAVENPDNLKAWPLAEHSIRYPLSVRYQYPGDQVKAREVLAVLEHSWQVEIDVLGFRPPFAFDPFAKPGEPRRLHAFLQRGAETAVEGRSPVKADGVWWDAYDAWVSIDAWGKYAGKILASTVAHEFNHALHAAYDWHESPGFFETSATYIQEKVTPDDNDYLEQIEDFQQHPHWPIHYDDGYKTWYMYGASLYLFFLEQRYFNQDPTFLAKIWEGSRNRPRPLDPNTELPAPISNEPDWVDALENLLPRGVSYADTVAEFARWRWYTGRRSDGRHFHEAHLLKPRGEVKVRARLQSGQPYRSSGPLLGGSEYVTVKRLAGQSAVQLDFSGAAGIRWVVQAVPGIAPGTNGELIALSGGKGEMQFGALAERTLVITALPADGVLDPDRPATAPLSFRLNAVASR